MAEPVAFVPGIHEADLRNLWSADLLYGRSRGRPQA